MSKGKLITQTRNIDMKGIRMSIMDVDQFIKDRGIQEVTSFNIFDTVSNNFHDEGLFSERIFGASNSHQRSTTMGYIDLHVRILHPYIYKKLTDIDSIIPKLLAGNTPCKFNPTTKRFELATDEDKGPLVGKGFSFFKKHVDKYQLSESMTSSLRKKAAVKMLNKFRSRWFINKLIVLPAGLRDIHEDDGRISKDDINNLYLNILSMSNSLEPASPSDRETNPLYDYLVFNMQKKADEIFTYLYNFVNGKYGFLQRRFGSRAVAGSTRNVITVSNIESDTFDDPSFLSAKKIQISFVEAIKELTHLMTHAFINQINQLTNINTTNNILAIDPKTFKQVYVEISVKERERFTDPSKINNIFNSFLKKEFRYKPLTIIGRDKKEYGIMIIYDDIKTNKIYVGTNIDHLKGYIEKDLGRIDQDRFRLINYYEYLYIIGLPIISNRTTTICRFPITSKWSHQEGEILVATTTPNRFVRVHMLIGDPDDQTDMRNTVYSGMKDEKTDSYPKLISMTSSVAIFAYPSFPDIYTGRPIDSIVPNNVWLSELGADFDGDTVSNYVALSNEANQEIKDFINSPQRLIDINLTLIPKVNTGSVTSFLKYITK